MATISWVSSKYEDIYSGIKHDLHLLLEVPGCEGELIERWEWERERLAGSR